MLTGGKMVAQGVIIQPAERRKGKEKFEEERGKRERCERGLQRGGGNWSMNGSREEEEEEKEGACEDMEYELGGGQGRVRRKGELEREERKRGLRGRGARCEGI